MAGRLEQAVMGGSPRAATTDAAAQRDNLMAMNRAVEKIAGIPGLIDKVPAGANDQAVYAKGLQAYQDGNTPGAVAIWSTIPHHPEARRIMERIYQQGQGR